MNNQKLVSMLALSCISFLIACGEDNSKVSKPQIQELNTTSIGGIATQESLLGLNCEISDPPLLQSVILGLNLRQNMELTQVEGSEEVIAIDLGSQNNIVTISNNIVNQSRQILVGSSDDNSVSVKLSLDVNGSDVYSLKFQDESVLEIMKTIDMDGNASYSKVGSTSSVNCEDFATLEDTLNLINSNPALDPNIQGPQ